ncbi:long-chain fatty acid--CoA ligase [Streptomyces sp. SID13666]|uniref:AMP-dependent synthetase/ligase n=1 Tax=unclassified Streptomyces TaxID=2593676 RepID=UPI0013C0632C|nr:MULTISPECIES: AMP-dependent synthetase/ligase [unclassified Streptomyces]NEA53894.1 long-chain fatty acid--CoA ligase [Streptomyces sp. SID13666]NEA76239.1 long-chain fatty acid--CoA ligase [Streptomyces sp. SID13588]
MPTILRLPAEPSELTLPALLLRNAEDHGDLPALSWRTADGSGWTTLTWSDVRRKVAVLASGYAAIGVERGEHVLLMMGNRPEHWLSDLALVHLGAVPVSVYGTAAPEQIGHIARHSRARLVVVESAREGARWEPLLDDPQTRLRRIVVVEPGEAGPHVAYSSIAAQGVRLYDADAFEKGWRAVDPADPLTVVYTSGTTGDPKGVVISHRNVLLNGIALDRVADFPGHAASICYLPFAHIAERMLGIYLPVFRAGHVHLCADPQAVAATARELRPVQFFGVPRVWEKLTSSVRAALGLLPEERRAAVEAAAETARAVVKCRERGEEPAPALAAAYAEAKAAVLDPVLALAGFERLTWTASAAAPMPVDILEFWAGFGLVIVDAWGLTETTGVATTNSPGGFRFGSVGRPLDGVEVRTAEDGEILVRGPIVCAGYLRPDGTVLPATDADGWFPTGDVGRIDEDGYLWITDRKKEIIVLSSGKNVAPAAVENALKEHPLIGQALVHGDGRPYLVALLVLDPELAPAWADREGPEALRAEIARAVATANARLSRPEQIKRYHLLTDEWGPATGELTPSLKLKRRVIRSTYAEEIDSLYEG